MSTLAYAYESGYQDGLKAAGTEKSALEKRIDELCAEVERMRKTATMLANARTNLLAENAKLRKLADKLSILASCECEGCLHVDNCPLMAYGDECPVSLEVKLLKRELGIEAHVKEDE